MSKKPHYCMELADSEERLKRCFAACTELEAANDSLRAERDAAQAEVERLAVEGAAMRDVLEHIQAIINESVGIAGWHLNGAIAEWDEFDVFANELPAALSTPATAAHVERVKRLATEARAARDLLAKGEDWAHFGTVSPSIGERLMERVKALTAALDALDEFDVFANELPAALSTPVTAAHVERVRTLEEVARLARELMALRFDDFEWADKHQELGEALDKLDKLKGETNA